MIEGASMVGVVAGVTMGLIVVLVLAIVLFRRTVQELPALREKWKEIYAQKGDVIRRWNRWGCAAQLLYASLVVLLLASGGIAAFALAAILGALIFPLSFIMQGLRILTLGYAEIRPVLGPLYFVTSGQATRRGKVMLAGCILLLIPWLWFVVYVLEGFELV
jgi:uncharacterized membrane protein YjjP (DUF1212 family)